MPGYPIGRETRQVVTGPENARGRTIPSSLTAGLVGAGHAVVAAAAVAGCLVLVQSDGRPGDLATELVQASGIVALLWAYAGLVLGLLIGIRPAGAGRRERPSTRTGRSLVLNLHRQINVVVVALTLLQALVFAFGMPGGSLLVAFVPGLAGPQSLGYALGIIALYLALLLGPTYYLRDRIGRRTWLIAHQFAALSYAIALRHSLALGSDVRMQGVGRTLTWACRSRFSCSSCCGCSGRAVRPIN
jgi:predicted ferric reductase